MKIEILKYRAHSKNTLQAFLDLLITPGGIEIRDATLHDKNGKRWVGLPARPYTDRDGNQSWAKIVAFPEDADHSAFQRAALEAIDAYHGAKDASHDIPF